MVYNDSQLVVNQVSGRYQAKDTKMITYLGIVEKLRVKLELFEIQLILRDRNLRADLLANLGATTESSGD